MKVISQQNWGMLNLAYVGVIATFLVQRYLGFPIDTWNF
jgi:hypothetical protein